MNPEDQFSPAQREVIVAECASHYKHGYDAGYDKGRGDGQAISVADWVRGILKSWTMWVGSAGVMAGLSAEVWPAAADILKDYIDPRTLALASAIFMMLRVKTKDALGAK